jgi:hypothetical protein
MYMLHADQNYSIKHTIRYESGHNILQLYEDLISVLSEVFALCISMSVKLIRYITQEMFC